MGPVAIGAIAIAAGAPAAPLGAHVATAESARAAPGLANREFRETALFLVPFDARQLRANQRPMDRPLLDDVAVVVRSFGFRSSATPQRRLGCGVRR